MFSSRFIRPAVSTFARATPRPIITNTPLIASRFFTTSSPKMTVHNIATMEEFKETIAKNQIVVLDAFATWCGPCKAIAPQIAKWSEEEKYKETVYFAKFDVDAMPELAQELGIRAMPTFVIFKDGNKVDEFVGANPPVLLTTINKHVSPQ